MKSEHDPLERHLRKLPLRPLPPAWRREILERARGSEGNAVNTPRSERALLTQLSNFFWPSPWAWGGLAAIWIGILTMNFAAHSLPAVEAKTSVHSWPIGAQAREAWREQQQLTAELLGEKYPRPEPRPVKNAPRPRVSTPERHGDHLAGRPFFPVVAFSCGGVESADRQIFGATTSSHMLVRPARLI